MTKSIQIRPYLFAFGIPLLLILSLIALLQSQIFSANASQLSTFITIDFILTIPIIYFLLIRKTNVSKLTIAPFLIACIVIASYAIPEANQDMLSLAKTWLIPIVELSVISIVIYKVTKAIKSYKAAAKKGQDFFTILNETSASLFPKTAAKLVANEIALIYYGFFNFKKVELKANEFSNYKGSGILSTLVAVIFVVAIEMVSIHILASKWSSTLAWILTGLSIYSALQLIGIIRSVPKRPIQILENELVLRFGMLSETSISYSAIESIAIAHADDYKSSKNTKTISLLGSLENSNIVIRLKSPHRLAFLYGKAKTYRELYFFVDDHQRFVSQIESKLSNPM
ncbi:hypothetical protein [Psychroserpens sp.]|uniref:hypothetical protein n=1 Tax=Psychroserpens sp. TaxID=2020870 RepID=UPI001B1B5F01|nr:hypothetical protein [Psychroserpens sp.]MBO6606999.1 hypothetical protein [Psychroserpens sp.]MBO6630540.1 hypothetical protein [Psychroserpens sp.]MBO6654145.1 hypothetical protein [Psychroserpens sp.]MBO6682569.1 hypothetical protein [Psychroserpens sp.]MBO6750771.1 hypothetical protein [Psychroserpens sp.]